MTQVNLPVYTCIPHDDEVTILSESILPCDK